jgi:hypothetical protein
LADSKERKDFEIKSPCQKILFQVIRQELWNLIYFISCLQEVCRQHRYLSAYLQYQGRLSGYQPVRVRQAQLLQLQLVLQQEFRMSRNQCSLLIQPQGEEPSENP